MVREQEDRGLSRHFPLSTWQLYLQGATGVGLSRLLAIATELHAQATATVEPRERQRRRESLEWSFVLHAFTLLELLSNALLKTAEYLHDVKKWRPLTPRGLSPAHLVLVARAKTKRLTTVEKLQVIPEMLGTLYSRAVHVDFQEEGWKAILRVRSIRNRLVHISLADAEVVEGRISDQRKRGQSGLINLAKMAEPDLQIPKSALWDALFGLAWYLNVVDRLPGFRSTPNWSSNKLYRKRMLQDVRDLLASTYKYSGVARTEVEQLLS